MTAPQSDVPCTHGVRHVCGTRPRYLSDRCRCTPCRAANTAAQQRRRKQTAYGRWQPFVDAAPVREHVRELAASGVGYRRVLELSGVGSGTLNALVYGTNGHPPSARVRAATRDAILAVRPGDLAPGAQVDATATRRRLQALAVEGWSAPALAVVGLQKLAVRYLLSGGAKTTRATAETVAALFPQLLADGPPSATPWQRTAVTKARAAAAAAGWLPASAWDDIDDVDERPDAPGEVDAMTALAEDVEWLLAAGGNWYSVPGRLGRSRAALERTLQRSRRHDLVAALTAATHGTAAA